MTPNLYGTPLYMAPEQIGGQPATTRTDIYALGLVIYEMVTGGSPFMGETPILAAMRRLSDPPIPPRNLVPDISPIWESAIIRCLERDPANRFANAQEVVAALLREEPATCLSPVDTKAAPSFRKRTKRQLGLMLLLLLGVLSVGIYQWVRPVASGKTSLSAGSIKILRLTNDGKSSAAAISRDGKYVAYVRRDGNLQSLWVRQVATASDVQILSPKERVYSNLTFSADGNHLFFADGSSDDSGETRKDLAASGTSLRKVPSLGGTPVEVVVPEMTPQFTFSPDGKQLCFAGSRGKLYFVSPDGTRLRALVPSPFHLSALRPAWSPDGRTLAVWDTGSDSTSPQMEGTRKVLGFDLYQPQPDLFGHGEISTFSIASVLGVQLGSGAIPGDFVRPLSPRKFEVGRLEWMPDGTGLAFDGREKPLDPSQIWFISYPGGEVSRITNDLSD
jgi:WD40 repeat protein